MAVPQPPEHCGKTPKHCSWTAKPLLLGGKYVTGDTGGSSHAAARTKKGPSSRPLICCGTYTCLLMAFFMGVGKTIFNKSTTQSRGSEWYFYDFSEKRKNCVVFSVDQTTSLQKPPILEHIIPLSYFCLLLYYCFTIFSKIISKSQLPIQTFSQFILPWKLTEKKCTFSNNFIAV